MINSLLLRGECSSLQKCNRSSFICCPCVSINYKCPSIFHHCASIFSTRAHSPTQTFFVSNRQHPFNDRGFSLRSIEAPAVVLHHGNESLCNNERWLVTTHRMPGVTRVLTPAHAAQARDEREEESVGQWRQDRTLQARQCQCNMGMWRQC